MRKVALLACLTMLAIPASAELLTCDALKARVDAKLQAKGVPSYSLEFITVSGADRAAASGVPATPKGKEVGSCDNGKKRLMYIRGN